MMALVGDHLWQSTLVAALLALLTLVFRENRAHVRYWLWLAASMKFLVPFAALVEAGRRFGWRQLPITTPAALDATGVPLVIEMIGHPFSRPEIAMRSDSAFASTISGVAPVLPDLLLALWLAGCAVVLVSSCVKWRRIARVVRDAVTVESGEVLDTLRRLEATDGCGKPVALVSSTASCEPGVFGILKPVLLWPQSMTGRLTHDEVEAVLAHELCHVRRRDNAAAALHMAVEALFWFHPMAWWLGARLVEERERACDEDVLRHGSRPEVYAESILKTCRLYLGSPLACVSGVTGSNLKWRIEKIMRNDADAALNIWKKVLLATVAMAGVAIPLAIGVTTAPRLQAQDQQIIVGGAPGGGAGRIDTSDPSAATFEVASVKPNKSGDGRVMLGMQPGGRFTATNVPLRLLIRNAYQLQDFQIADAPGWIATDRFDIIAKAEGNLPPVPIGGPPGPMQFMLRNLLAERFNLKVHTETRDMPMYALTLARGDKALGPQLKPSASDCAALAAARRGGPPPALPPPGERPMCGMRIGPGQMAGGGFPMSQLANTLSLFVQRIVVDRTGLTGTFDLDLTWTPDQLPQGPPPPGAPPLPPIDPNGPSIFTALQEQLGLKLESTRGPVDVLVIDNVTQPTPD